MTPYERALGLIKAKHRRDNPNRRVFSHDKAQAQYVEFDPDTGIIRYNYRGTDIAILNQMGEILLDTGGWPTQTTKRCMERVFSRTGITIRIEGSTLRNGEMPKHPNRWHATTMQWEWDGERWHRHLLGYFEDCGPGVSNGVRTFRQGFTWGGGNTSEYPRQNLLITPTMLDSIPDRRAA